MKKCIFVLFALALFSCHSSQPISVLNETSLNNLSIYFLSGDTVDKKAIEKLAKEKFPDFKNFVTILPTYKSNAYSITLQKAAADVAPPTVSALQYFGKGLSDDQKLKLQNYSQALAISFLSVSKDVYDVQLRISRFIDELVKNKDVVIFDGNTYDWCSPEWWTNNRVNNFQGEVKDITSQISVPIYRTEGYCRAVTMGMNKFCLPDISISNFPCSNQNTFGSIVNAVVQTLAENPNISADSTLTIDLNSIKNSTVKAFLLSDIIQPAKLTAILKLKQVVPEEGDADNIQLMIAFEDPAYSSPQEEQQKIVSDLFGASDSVINVTHDEAIGQASKKACERLPELRKLFNKGLEPGYSILVKAPFKIEEGRREWMWVEITKWPENTITGILQNDAFEIENLKAGAIVTVNEKDIFDYILNKPDGTMEGNETSPLLEAKSKADNR
jgi:uncharacterized protein YegJ (DUF2314 family)